MTRGVLGLIAVALAALVVPVAIVHAAAPNVVYFPQTGHNVGEPFLTYWRDHGGLAMYGYPLTEAIQEKSATDGKTYTVQYFERARLEAHPENQAPYNVLLGQLGRTLAAHIVGNPAFDKVPADKVTASETNAYFPQTGHTLSGAFLDYWKANGGLAQFGYPLSEPFLEKSPTDGKVYTVQYFERNRFELHPENKPPYNVLLGLLGRQIAQQSGLSLAAAPRQNGVPDYDPSLFYTPTLSPTATATAAPKPTEPRPDLGAQYVEVNLSQQHLYAWQNGQVVFDVTVSSGRPGWETPTGTFYVNQRFEDQDMTGGGQPGDPNYYFQPDVPWIQYFDNNGDALHGNYWNENFGTPTSHGCVGMPVDAAKWLFNWGYIGLPVWIHG